MNSFENWFYVWTEYFVDLMSKKKEEKRNDHVIRIQWIELACNSSIKSFLKKKIEYLVL